MIQSIRRVQAGKPFYQNDLARIVMIMVKKKNQASIKKLKN